MKNYLRRTWAEVDIDALKHNFDEIRASVDPKAKIICVIKADAYGHGAVFLGKLYEKWAQMVLRYRILRKRCSCGKTGSVCLC